jgi:hypothetical protein
MVETALEVIGTGDGLLRLFLHLKVVDNVLHTINAAGKLLGTRFLISRFDHTVEGNNAPVRIHVHTSQIRNFIGDERAFDGSGNRGIIDILPRRLASHSLAADQK